MERIAPENQDAFDTTTASLADKPVAPASRFTLKNLADVDPMTEYREAAKKMAVGQLYDGLTLVEARMMARAIEEAHGERTSSTETDGDFKRVLRVEQRPLTPRKPKTAKKAAEPKPKAGKNV